MAKYLFRIAASVLFGSFLHVTAAVQPHVAQAHPAEIARSVDYHHHHPRPYGGWCRVDGWHSHRYRWSSPARIAGSGALSRSTSGWMDMDPVLR